MTTRSGNSDLEFPTRADFEAWLREAPREWSIILAARAALRASPIVATERLLHYSSDEHLANVTSVAFRAVAVARAAVRTPTPRIAGMAATAAKAAADVARATEAPPVEPAALAVANAATAASHGGLDEVIAAASEAYLQAVGAASIYCIATSSSSTAIASMIAARSQDVHFLAIGGSPRALASEPLWLQGTPEWAVRAWTEQRTTLPRGEDWEVWVQWYEARLQKALWSDKKELIYINVPLEAWNSRPATANAWIRQELESLKSAGDDAAEDRNLVEQSPAPTSFRIIGDKIDAAPETANSIDDTIAAAFYDEAKRKARELRERLERAQADKRLQANLALLEARLGVSLADVSGGHLLPSLYSLERDFSVYNSEDGRKEHSLELIAALGDAAGAVRDFVSLFPKVRLIEAEALALRIVQQPEAQEEIAEQGRNAIAAARESPHVTPAAASALQDTEKSVTTARDADERARQLSYLVLDLRNFARANIALALKGLGGLAGDCWADIRKKVPPVVGTLTRISLFAFGLSTLVDQLAPAKIKLLKEVGGVARDLGKAIEEGAPKASDRPSSPEKGESKSQSRRDSHATEKDAARSNSGKRAPQKRKR